MNPPQSTSKPRILLVESHDHDVMMFHRILQKHRLEWHIHSVARVADALAYLARPQLNPPPDILVTELQLTGSGPTGLQLLTWARQHPSYKNLPIIVHSDHLDPQYRERALALGATQFVQKSPDMLELLQTISRHLQGSPKGSPSPEPPPQMASQPNN